MMKLGYCTNCARSYREVPIQEFIGLLHPEEKRVYSVCSDCYGKLNDEMAQHVFEEDRSFVIHQIEDNILRTKLEKIIQIQNWQKKKLIGWAYNAEGLPQ